MTIFLVCASGDLRSAIVATGASFYMPFQGLAVLSFDGTADVLARRLDAASRGNRRAGIVRFSHPPASPP